MHIKIVLLGEKKENQFVNLIGERYKTEWVREPGDVDPKCAYVVIMTQDISQAMILKDELLHLGVEEDKVLAYSCFIKDPNISRMDYFQNEYCKYEYDSFWFGMSHSLGGLVEELIKGKRIYKFSAPSMDLYYHFQLLTRIEKIYDITKIKNIYFELPYYAFNYDVSRCVNVFQQRINFFYYLEDYHHFRESQFGEWYTDMFEKMNELTGNKFYGRFQISEIKESKNKKNQTLSMLKRNFYHKFCKKNKHHWTEQEVDRVKSLNPHVWDKDYPDTLGENKKIWASILGWMGQHEWIKMKVIVFPFCPYFIHNHQKVIAVRRKEFFEGMGEVDDMIIDMFEYYMKRPEYFADECHLNMRGAYEFSKDLCELL